MSDYETIIASREGRVQVIQLNRPKALNALNAKLIAEVLEVCRAADADEGVGCIPSVTLSIYRAQYQL